MPAPAARAYEHANELIQDNQVEAVLVCTPGRLHAEQAIAAFAARKHLYLEKPLATSMADAECVVDASRTAGTVGMIGFNYRQHPVYVAIRNAVIGDEIGRVISVRVCFCTQRRQMASWRRYRNQGGGVLLEFASHEIDLVHFVLGEPIVEISAQLSSRDAEDDTVHVQGRTASGVGVQGFFSSCAIEEAGMEVYGDAGKLTVDRYGRLTLERRGAAAPGPVKNTLDVLRQWRGLAYMVRRMRSPWREPSFEQSLRYFLAGVRAGVPVSPDLLDGLRSLAVVAAAEASATHNRVEQVTVPDAAPTLPPVPFEPASEGRAYA